MDKRRRELEELRDDTHLALLMDDYAEAIGEQVRAEAEEAFATGEITIPQELDITCRSLLKEVATTEHTEKPVRFLLRYALVAAATIVLLFGTLVGVQASGVDVFGAIASWSDSVFHFGKDKKPTQQTNKNDQAAQIRTALYNKGIPLEFAPILLPDGYTITSIKETDSNYLSVVGVKAVSTEGKELRITFEKNQDETIAMDTLWEKTDPSAQSYKSGDREFYILENEKGWSGIWSDGRFTISYYGFETIEALKTTIDSMGK